MKRIIIICEGQTEQSFCNDVLKPYFSPLEIFLATPAIKKTHGGIVPWYALKHQIEKHLLEDKTAHVTTMIDYYGIQAHHGYPGWNEAETKADRNERMDIIEKEMKNDIRDDLRVRFKPYIQLHEFEGILFSDISVFDRNFEKNEFADYDYLASTIRENPNPEMINNGYDTAPSKRLSKIIKHYSKTLFGALLAHEIGLPKIRGKCPRFNNWILQLEKM